MSQSLSDSAGPSYAVAGGSVLAAGLPMCLCLVTYVLALWYQGIMLMYVHGMTMLMLVSCLWWRVKIFGISKLK
ncbi:hypothetical protein PEPE_0536 [Pediococcus pentosaceus ATCC 25745]|uniref:Uncharacterized protein n=1 Tax=Pediococcus pentosaceus (strain ATCC 25745 / CCUG 21536 / LMG 10740 / 183-1w) TaxID=278197 RepID=Q03GP7_PEDPA|nr:hypothetical protein PEPE_0536 [Pediococcus pentosaceus ATCC 25745]